MLKIEWLEYHFCNIDFGFSRAFLARVKTEFLDLEFKGHVVVTVDPYKGKAKGSVICSPLGAMPTAAIKQPFGEADHIRPYNPNYALLELESKIKSRINRALKLK